VRNASGAICLSFSTIRPFSFYKIELILEHQFFLGSRLRDIAGEKAGIVKRGVDLVTAATQPSVLNLFKEICEKRKAPFWRVGKDVHYRITHSRLNYYGLKHRFKGLELGLKGRFQYRNAALALAATEILEMKRFKISSHDIKEGLVDTAWSGRMHIVSREPLTILDGAHNPAAIGELADSISRDFTFRRLILVLGVMEDKDISRIIQRIVPLADYIIYTRPEYYRAANPEILMKEAIPLGKPGKIVPMLSDALDRAKEIASAKDMILITGSLFTIGETLTHFDPEKYRPDDF